MVIAQLTIPKNLRETGCDYYDPIQREMEKERIRKEIIAKDMAKRRVLEAEVRREMMIERERGL